MDREVLDHLLGAFCHTRDDRSFFFSVGHSLLCHRCSGIYGGFALAWIWGTVFRWNGVWRSGSAMKPVLTSAVVLLGLCGLQWALQLLSEDWFGGPWHRYVAGLLAGLGLLQLSHVEEEHREGSPWPLLALVPLVVVFGWASQSFFVFNSITVMVGLLMLYLQVNAKVVLPSLSKSPWLVRGSALVALVAVEWGFLYWFNVHRHHG